MNKISSKIWPLIILVVFLIGGILVWQYYEDIVEEKKLPNEKDEKFVTLKEVTKEEFPNIFKEYVKNYKRDDRQLLIFTDFYKNLTQSSDKLIRHPDYSGYIGIKFLPHQFLEMINEDYLVYFTSYSDKVEVYRTKIDNLEEEELINVIEKAEYTSIDKLTFADKDTFATCASYFGDISSGRYYGYWNIYIYQKGQKKVIEKIHYTEADGIPETACMGLSFSPDDKKIVTEGLRKANFAYDIYAFDLNGKQLAKIENAANANWLDNETIIFSSRNENKICLFNILSYEIKKCCETKDIFLDPQLSRNFQKLVYWTFDWTRKDDKGTVGLLDLKTCESEKILEDASNPLWISPKEILISKNQELQSVGIDIFPIPLSFLVFNIFTKEKVEIFDVGKIVEAIEREGEYNFLSPLGGNYSFYFKHPTKEFPLILGNKN